jgi:Ribosomal protein L14E/L6E/L27E
MMQNGMVVRANAGRDKDRFYVVLDVQGDRVLIADGKRRKLQRPKAKNQKHLCVTSTVFEPSAMQTDRALRERLRPFNLPQQTSKRGRESGFVKRRCD